MSGWIKIERSLLSDLRFRKVVRKIAGISGNADKSLPPVTITLVLGALTQLWLHADEHISENDLLRGSVDDINDLVGIENFCQSLPGDWLKVVDPDHVQLTDFVNHNGTSARERKLNAERQARFKAKNRGLKGNAGVTDGNADNAAKPDQTKQKKQNKNQRRGTRIPDDFALNDARKAFAIKHQLDPVATLDKFRDYWNAAVKGTKLDWDATWRNWCRTERAAPKPNGHHPAPSNDVAAWAEAKALAKSIGYSREPYPHETAAAYMTSIKLAAVQPVMLPISERVGRVIKRVAP